MMQRIVLMSALASLTAASGCAALEAAQNERLDRAVTVSSAEPLYTYQRVGLEPMRCQGARCPAIQADHLAGALRQALGDGCYQVVDASEMERYADHYSTHYADMDMGMGMSFKFRGPDGFMVDFTTLTPDLRDTLVEELGLDGVVKSSITIGRPDEITQWRSTTIDVQLIDARHRHTVWQARLTGDLDDESMQQGAQQLMSEVAVAIRRKAGACGQPPVAPTSSITVVDDRLQIPGRIFFDLGKASLSARSHGVLDDVVAWLGAHPEVTMVVIEGHTDDAGDDTFNLKLSEGRAAAVRDYLAARGVVAGRLDAQGFGEGRPLVTNDSAANRARNRRVEFRVFD